MFPTPIKPIFLFGPIKNNSLLRFQLLKIVVFYLPEKKSVNELS